MRRIIQNKRTYGIIDKVLLVGTIIFLLIITIMILNKQVEMYNDMEDWCNVRYGEGNWILNNTSGSTAYIGNTYNCVEIYYCEYSLKNQ
jgi:hypothetical protein